MGLRLIRGGNIGMRLLFALAIFLACVPTLAQDRMGLIQARGALIVGVKNDYPPWGMLDENRELVGLEIDLAHNIADTLGVELSLVPVSSSNRISRVNQGVVDLLIATTGDTLERRQQADFLQPNYYASGVVVYGRRDVNVASWADLRGQPICLTRGAYYNRALERDFGIQGVYLAGRKEALLALQLGRCIGWAFDDTALVQFMRTTPDPRYGVMVPPIMNIPWALVVAKGEGDGEFGRFVEDQIIDWHRTGHIMDLQKKWDITTTPYVRAMARAWSELDEDGLFRCRRLDDGAFPQRCINTEPFQSAKAVVLPPWAVAVRGWTGADLSVAFSPYARSKLAAGLGRTLGLAALSISGAVGLGFGLFLLRLWLTRLGRIGQLLAAPVVALMALARMTPPILQLYIAFFGLGGLFLATPHLTPSGFSVAVFVFSLYAGAAIAALLHQSNQPGPVRAFIAAYDGLVATVVNIVKAAGMASAIAVGEIISTVNLLIAQGAHTPTLMNGLLVLYFLLVLGVLGLFGFIRARVTAA